MNVLSLFDGAACAMVCLKRAGIEIENYYSSDIKKSAIRCEQLLAEHLGVNQIQLGDCTKIDYSELPKIDLICAGFPCQDYSLVNSRKQGMAGKNGQLFWEVVRAIKALNPKYIIMENVSTIPSETLEIIQKETGCFENRIVDPVELGWATRRKRIFFTNFLSFLDMPIPRKTRETLAELLDDDAKVFNKRLGNYPNEVEVIPCQLQQQAHLNKIGNSNSGSGTVIAVKRLDRHGLHDVDEIPTQMQAQALTSTGKRNKEGLVIGVLNNSRDTVVFSQTEIGTQVQNQPTRAGEGCFILTNDKEKTPYRRKKTEKVHNAGYDSFRCPTQAELARFHTYPVEIMEQFTPPQAQSLMGDGWHCGSIQWLFDKLKEIGPDIKAA